jgi:hypothetical protein
MRRLALLASLALAAPAWADPLPAHAPRVADYDIRVKLDPEAKTLTGSEHITWHNPASEPVGELWFHLYLNAFKNSESTFFKESGGQLRGDEMPDEGWGFIDVKSIRRKDEVDLAGGARFEQPDDGNAADRTVWRVPLPEPVPAGGTIELDVEFTAKLPRVFARTGYFRDYFLVGQWFPKLAVFEPAGARGRPSSGWNCHQFHANSEFYADFGRYLVEITAPKSYVIGATGTRGERRDNPDGTSTHVFERDDVIDFAWTASPRFVEVTARFSGQQDVSEQEYAEVAALLGRSREEVQLTDVDIHLLLQPEHLAQRERHLRAAKAAIKWFGLWYGRYPYPTITIVDPAFGAGGSGGMEYPTFITAGTSVLLNRWPLDRVLAPEEVVVHEFGHQYWQSMVASNEFEESWLDEGFNSYSTGKVMDKVYGEWMIEAFGLRLGGLELSRMQNSVERMFDRIRTPCLGLLLQQQLRLQLLRAHRADAAHARRARRRADARARDAHLPRALPLPPPDERRLLRRRERGGGTRPLRLLRADDRAARNPRRRGGVGEEREGGRAAGLLWRGRRQEERHREGGAREGEAGGRRLWTTLAHDGDGAAPRRGGAADLAAPRL